MNHFPFLIGKKILLVSHELSLTGAPLLLIETGTTLVKSGAEVALINVGFRDPAFLLPELDGFRVLPVEKSFAAASDADLIIANTAATKEWVQRLLESHPSAGLKLIWWIHEMQIEFFGQDMSCLSQACAAIFDSDSSYRIWKQTDLPMPATTRVIHPGISADFLQAADKLQSAAGDRSRAEPQLGPGGLREAIRRQLSVSPEDFLVSLFGSYCCRKGHDVLVETVGEMLEHQPDLPLKLLLIGFRSDSERHNFMSTRSEIQSRSLRPNRVLREVVDLRPYYLATDAFVMNTQDEGEAFGRVTIEAMAFRLPVLGTACGGTKEIVIDGVTGLLHPPGREGKTFLAGNILKLMNNRSRASALGEAGFQRVSREFTDLRFYQGLAEILEMVCRRQAHC
jgi:glycosyltransferase involved in cell wall biosynthesis